MYPYTNRRNKYRPTDKTIHRSFCRSTEPCTDRWTKRCLYKPTERSTDRSTERCTDETRPNGETAHGMIQNAAYLDKPDCHGVQSFEAVGRIRRLHRPPPHPFQVCADRLRKKRKSDHKSDSQSLSASQKQNCTDNLRAIDACQHKRRPQRIYVLGTYCARCDTGVPILFFGSSLAEGPPPPSTKNVRSV